MGRLHSALSNWCDWLGFLEKWPWQRHTDWFGEWETGTKKSGCEKVVQVPVWEDEFVTVGRESAGDKEWNLLMLAGMTHASVTASDEDSWGGINEFKNLWCTWNLWIKDSDRAHGDISSLPHYVWDDNLNSCRGPKRLRLKDPLPSDFLTHMARTWSGTAEGQAELRLPTRACKHGLSVWLAFLVSWWLGSERKSPEEEWLVAMTLKTPKWKGHGPFWPSSEVPWHHFCHILLITNLNKYYR